MGERDHILMRARDALLTHGGLGATLAIQVDGARYLAVALANTGAPELGLQVAHAMLEPSWTR